MKKKLFSVIMCVLMVMCFMPSMAFAASVDTEATTESSCAHAAAIGKVHYDTLKEAVEAATEGQTVELLKDIEISQANCIAEKATVDKNITIDGKNHKITATGTGVEYSSGSIYVTSTTGATIKNINFVDLKNVGRQAAGIYLQGAKGTEESPIQIIGCSFTGADNLDSAGQAMGISSSGSTEHQYLTVEDCTFKNLKYAMYMNGFSNMTIENCEFDGTLYNAINLAATAAVEASNNVVISGNTMTNISSGNYNDDLYASAINIGPCASNVTISGNNISVLNNKKALNVVTGATNVVVKNGTYSDLSALPYMEAGSTLKLNADIALTSTLNLSKDITLDFNGKTITSSGTNIAILICDKANVTFKDSSTAGNGGITNNYNNNDKANTIKVKDGATLTIENGKYVSSSLGDVTIVDAVNSAIATIKGGTFTAAKDASDANKKEGKVFYSGADSENDGNQNNHGKVIVTGGTFTGRLSTSNWGVYEISGGTFDRNTVVKYNNPTSGASTKTDDTITMEEAGMLADGYVATKNNDGTYTVGKKVVYGGGSGGSGSSSSGSASSGSSAVVNTTETKTDSSAAGTTTTTTVPETKATVKAETKTAADGTKTTTATVDTAVATQIVEKAVENKSEEVVVTTATTPVAETAAGTTTEVAIPAETVSQIAEKTTAAVTIESEAAKVTLDQQAVEAVAETAGETGTVSLVVETKAQDANKVEVELKLETSNGTVSDFKGGSVSVTVKLNAALAAKPVTCVYIDDNGNYHKVAGHKNADGTYTFTTKHFSTYAIMAVEEADAVIATQTENVTKLVNDLSLKARSSKTKKGNIKVTLTVDADEIQAIEDLGYTVKYKFYRSTKKASSYKAKIEGKGKTYTNTSGKKGTKYYYKARVMVYDSEGTLIAKTALKQCKYACRVK